MDYLSEKIKNLPEVDYPIHLHDQIMGRVGMLKFGNKFFIALMLLFLNFIIASYFFIIRSLDNEAPLFFNFMIRQFEISNSYFSDLAGVIRDTLPLGLFFTLIINVALIIYVMRVYFLFKKSEVILGRSLLK